jgi:hypothetical protein
MFRRSFAERCMLLYVVHVTILGGDCINYSFLMHIIHCVCIVCLSVTSLWGHGYSLTFIVCVL